MRSACAPTRCRRFRRGPAGQRENSIGKVDRRANLRAGGTEDVADVGRHETRPEIDKRGVTGGDGDAPLRQDVAVSVQERLRAARRRIAHRQAR